jgi:hypothetical protein
MRRQRLPSLVVMLALSFSACGDDGPGAERGALVLAFADVPARAAGRTTLDAVALEAHWDRGAPAVGVSVDLFVDGGATVTPERVTTDGDGVARFSWTLGALPITNRITADAGELGRGEASVQVDPPAALASSPFADVERFLGDRQSDGSTEDLAFAPDGSLVMAYGGSQPGLFRVAADGSVTALAVSGEALANPLGLAFDHAGALYIADGARRALMKVVHGVVAMLAERDGVEAFLMPNDVAVGPDGTVYLSDTCTGKVYAVHPDSGEILARIAFDPATEGGPNGVVVGPDGALWMASENTALFCGHDSVALTAAVGGLFRIPLGGEAVFGAKETVAAGVGVFGDGLAFDALGNLYVIFDTVEGFSLDESIVYVRPAGGGPLARAFAARGKVYANLAFGHGDFGVTTMYLAMLRVALVPNSPRGLERIEVGVTGAPLPPPR